MIDGGSVCKRCGTWYSGSHTDSNCANVFEERLKNRDEEMREIKEQTANSIYQILGKYGEEYEDIKSEFRELAKYHL